jgi:penicillin-binding protein 1C
VDYRAVSPGRLTPGEAALLVGMPQRPARLRPDRHPTAAFAAGDRVLKRLREEGILSDQESESPPPAIAERRSFPSLAFHVARRLQERPDHAGLVETTIDRQLQAAVEQLAARELDRTGDGAEMAVIVVDNRDRSIRAWFGGRHSFVDLARSRRSPGSTLKPFIYGLAFEDLTILPDSMVDDRPMRFGDYAPENFDREFHGQVTARAALQQSLNLPAIALLDKVGPGRLTAMLEAGGAHLTFPQSDKGPTLPLALGGVGINLADLTGLYVALADGGVARPLRLRPGQPAGAPATVLTEKAAKQVTDILRGVAPPDGRVTPLIVADARPIAYKTGTSYGFRDAWAAGYSPNWTVAVWTGRPDGTPRPGLYGRNMAAPLLFQVFDLLPAEDTPDRIAPPPLADVEPAPLPKGLKLFAGRGGTSLFGAAPPHIMFPPDGARLDLSQPDGSISPVTLQADGGTPPYRWAVNGVPVADAPWRGDAAWRPDGPGFARVTVLDAAGKRATAMIRLD